MDTVQIIRSSAVRVGDSARDYDALLNAKGATGKPWPVRAPTAGVALRVLQESERAVLTGTPLLEIGNPGDQEVVVDVLSSDAVSIRPGNHVMFERWCAIEGSVRALGIPESFCSGCGGTTR